jgi:hypothetical protein
MSSGFTLESVSTLHGLSPGFIIGQPIQQELSTFQPHSPTSAFRPFPLLSLLLSCRHLNFPSGSEFVIHGAISSKNAMRQKGEE